MDHTEGHHVVPNESDTERQMSRSPSYVGVKIKKQNKTNLNLKIEC